MSTAKEPSPRQYRAAIALLIHENESLRAMANVPSLRSGEREYTEDEIKRGLAMNLNAFTKGGNAVFSIDT